MLCHIIDSCPKLVKERPSSIKTMPYLPIHASHRRTCPRPNRASWPPRHASRKIPHRERRALDTLHPERPDRGRKTISILHIIYKLSRVVQAIRWWRDLQPSTPPQIDHRCWPHHHTQRSVRDTSAPAPATLRCRRGTVSISSRYAGLCRRSARSWGVGWTSCWCFVLIYPDQLWQSERAYYSWNSSLLRLSFLRMRIVTRTDIVLYIARMNNVI